MLSLAGSPLRHVTYGGGGYAVPRGDGRTLVGSTMERVAFDAGTTEAGLAHVRATGAAICPALATRPILNGWAGLRPITPDLLPILGREPELPAIVYACGHSRNGVLLAPLTGDVVADIVQGTDLAHDISPFRPDRFAA
jgi:glycine oxidase